MRRSTVKFKPTLRKVRPLGSSHSEWMLVPQIKPFKRGVGRNHHGRITTRNRGGGHKRKYRPLTWYCSGPAICQGLFYDPNRTAHVAIIKPIDKEKQIFWMLAPEDLKEGDVVDFGTRSDKLKPRPFIRKPLRDFYQNQIIHGIAKIPGDKQVGHIARAAGAKAKIVAINQEADLITVRLPSKRRVVILGGCIATRGIVSNRDHYLNSLYKAGQSRWLGRRPVVRGVAMNPVDHPHGGRTSGGRPSVTPWGKLTKGQPTGPGRRRLFVVGSVD